MWIIVIAFLVAGQPLAYFTQETQFFDNEALCQMHIDEAIEQLKKEVENGAFPVLSAYREKAEYAGKCHSVPGNKPKEHNI